MSFCFRKAAVFALGTTENTTRRFSVLRNELAVFRTTYAVFRKNISALCCHSESESCQTDIGSRAGLAQDSTSPDPLSVFECYAALFGLRS
jgi:hypothetical protein